MEFIGFDEAFEELLDDPTGRALVDDAHERVDLIGLMRTHREEAGLRQVDVAKAMDTQQSTVSELESTEVDPRLSTLQRYARAVGGRLSVAFVPTAPKPSRQRNQHEHFVRIISTSMSADILRPPTNRNSGRACFIAAETLAHFGKFVDPRPVEEPVG